MLFNRLKKFAEKNEFQGEISLFGYKDIPYCSLILIDNKWAIWTTYLYTISSRDSIRFVFKDVSSKDNQFKHFERHYDFLKEIDDNWTRLVESNKNLEEVKNAL